MDVSRDTFNLKLSSMRFIPLNSFIYVYKYRCYDYAFICFNSYLFFKILLCLKKQKSISFSDVKILSGPHTLPLLKSKTVSPLLLLLASTLRETDDRFCLGCSALHLRRRWPWPLRCLCRRWRRTRSRSEGDMAGRRMSITRNGLLPSSSTTGIGCVCFTLSSAIFVVV